MGRMQHGLIEPLAWDSEFFGVSIGRVELDGATETRLKEIETEARERGIDCLYGSLEPSDNHTSILVQQFDWRLIEVNVLFDRPAGPFTPPSPTSSTIRRGTPDDLPALGDAIARVAPWSRFGADPRFGHEAARRMHEAWITRAASEPERRLLSIAEDESGITGISACVIDEVPRIDFIGVLDTGSGASHALMADFFDWADHGPTQAGPCAARNIAVLRYVEICGFSARKTTYSFHWWADESRPG